MAIKSLKSWVQHSFDSHPFRYMSIGHPIPELRLFQNLTLKIKGQCHGEVTVQSHNVCLASYWVASLSFYANRPSHSWDTAFSKFDFENPGSRSNDHDVATDLGNSIELQMVEIWVSQSLAQVLPDLTSFWPKGKPIWGKWADNCNVAQLQV